MEFCEDEIIFGRFHRLRRLCQTRNVVKIQLLNVFSGEHFYYVDVYKSFEEHCLHMGSIVVYKGH